MIKKENSLMPLIKSPLRYPGGKSRALKQILPLIPKFKEFREPMVGGGSVFLALKQIYPEKKFWINDLNKELYFFWKVLKTDPQELIKELSNLRKNDDGKKLYLKFNGEVKSLNDFQRAVRFFLLNRITFSGLTESGGYSEESFDKRFTKSSIERLQKVSKILNKTKITNLDYEAVIKKPGNNVFLFLDPPYLLNIKSKLYGKNGHLHENFDHKRFAEDLKKCKHKWLITYDDSPEIRKLFSFANVYKWKLQWQYGMNNSNGKSPSKGDELFITNYKLN